MVLTPPRGFFPNHCYVDQSFTSLGQVLQEAVSGEGLKYQMRYQRRAPKRLKIQDSFPLMVLARGRTSACDTVLNWIVSVSILAPLASE